MLQSWHANKTPGFPSLSSSSFTFSSRFTLFLPLHRPFPVHHLFLLSLFCLMGSFLFRRLSPSFFFCLSQRLFFFSFCTRRHYSNYSAIWLFTPGAVNTLMAAAMARFISVLALGNEALLLTQLYPRPSRRQLAAHDAAQTSHCLRSSVLIMLQRNENVWSAHPTRL